LPFFEIIKKAAMNGEVTLYSATDDKFSEKIVDYEGIFSRRDTTTIINPYTYEDSVVVYEDETNYEDIKRFRIKEVWYFDEATSTLKVRILGIAALKDIFDENGNFRYEKPLFWIYYPHFRNVLARNEVYLSGNDYQQLSWDDLFEMRYFSSVIYKEGNVYDRRIKDYMEGLDGLLEADKIKKELFNFEQDLWSY
jgi:gliding motility associated protien GldN